MRDCVSCPAGVVPRRRQPHRAASAIAATTASLLPNLYPLSPWQTDFDGAEPGAGSVAADNLLRLSGYFGGDDGEGLRRSAAEQLATAFALPETPQAFPELGAALVTALLGPKQVRFVGVTPPLLLLVVEAAGGGQARSLLWFGRISHSRWKET